MMDLGQRLQALEDRVAIHDAVARFADACIHGDYGAFRRLWAPDAVWTIAPPFEARCDGIDEIMALLHRLRDGRDFFVQFAPQGVIEIDGDRASTRWVCREVARGPGEVFYDNHAVYHDRLRRSDDGWVFTSRSYRYLWLNTGTFPGDAFAAPGADTRDDPA